MALEGTGIFQPCLFKYMGNIQGLFGRERKPLAPSSQYFDCLKVWLFHFKLHCGFTAMF